MNGETSLKERISSMQERVLELQHSLPESPFQIELQRLQRSLQEMQKNPPAPAPQRGRRGRLRVVQPAAQPLPPMSAGENTIWKLFADFHQTLLAYAGGGQYLPREEWIGLANTAAEMTAGAQALGGPIMGVTDGSNAVPGAIGEYVSLQTNNTISTRYFENATDGKPFDIIGTLNLTPGDWQAGGFCVMEEIGEPTSYVCANLVGPTVGYQWFIRGVTAQDLSPHFSPMRANLATPFAIQMNIEVVTAGATQLVNLLCNSYLWARRVR